VAALTGRSGKPIVPGMQQLTDLFAKPGFRRAVASFGWLAVERAGRFVFGALVGLVVARHLGPVRLGTLSFCLAVITLLGFVPALGLDAVLKRELLKSPAKTAELLASGLVLRLVAGLTGYLGILGVAYLGWGVSREELGLFRILGLILFQPAAYLPELWLQAHLHAKRTTLIQLSTLALSSAVRVWLVVIDAPLSAFAWVIILELALCAGGYFFSARAVGLLLPLDAARRGTMRRLVAESWPLMFANLAVIVYLRIDEVMLRHLVGPAAVGVYSAAVKLSEIWYFLPTALATSGTQWRTRSGSSSITTSVPRSRTRFRFPSRWRPRGWCVWPTVRRLPRPVRFWRCIFGPVSSYSWAWPAGNGWSTRGCKNFTSRPLRPAQWRTCCSIW